MTSSQANASPLRQRMIDDMRMRQLAPKTQDTYLRIVREFARFLGRSPDTASVEDLRRYQLHSDPEFSAPLPADLMHAEAAPLPGSGPQTASRFQGWRYSFPRITVGVCRCHQRVCQPAYENPQLACWRVCCVAFAR